MKKKSNISNKDISHEDFISLINSIDDEGYVVDEYTHYDQMKKINKNSSSSSISSDIAHSDAKFRLGPIKFGLKRDNNIIKARMSVDTEFEKSTMNAVKQVMEKVRPVYEERLKHAERAAKMLTQTTLINKKQLEALENQIKELKNENEDVKRELIKCQQEKKGGSGGIKLDKDTQKILVESAMKQTKHVDEEVNQMEKIIKASKESIDKGVRDAMNTIEKGERLAAMMIQEADSQASEIQEIKENMEKKGQIPTDISNIPEAPPAPNFDKPQSVSILKKGREVDRINLTPRNASVADAVKAAIVEEKTDLFSQLRRAVEDRRTWIEPNGDGDNGDEWDTSNSSIRPSKLNSSSSSSSSSINAGRLVPRGRNRRNQQQRSQPIARINNLRFIEREEKKQTTTTTTKSGHKKNSSLSPTSPSHSSPPPPLSSYNTTNTTRTKYYNPYSVNSSSSLRHKHGGTVSNVSSGSNWLKGMTESIMSKIGEEEEEEEEEKENTKKVRFSGDDYNDSSDNVEKKGKDKKEEIIEEDQYGDLDPFALEEAIQRGSA
jgi:hypothetical protein